MKQVKRNYKMTKRAEQVNRNEQKILDATFSLWKQYSMHEITLDMVAENAGVTVRTILRKYGSKEGLIEYCIDNDIGKISHKRNVAIEGGVEQALQVLLDNYEEIGEAAIRTLAIEEELAVAKKALIKGRAFHREWCAKVFEEHLPKKNTKEYETRLHAFFAATDFYLWKLLRKDLGKSKKETYAVLWTMVEGLIKNKP
ncbi:MAG: TetR/AcrR family transcriptional regulator [Chitinophagales bacterium]